jgi:DNA-binding MarR family transcriptional regulator
MSPPLSASTPSDQPTDAPSVRRPPHLARFGADVAPVRRAPAPLARRFHQMCMGVQAEALAAAGLTALEYSVMATLNRTDGEPGIDQNSLAARLGVERSHASLIVEELTAKALVERRVNGADRRARLLSLTPKAEKLYARLRPAIRAANARVLEPLSPRERELFLDMMVRMIGANGAHARPGAGRRKRTARRRFSDERPASRSATTADRGTR